MCSAVSLSGYQIKFLTATCLHSAHWPSEDLRTLRRRLSSNPSKDSTLRQSRTSRVVESKESATDLAHRPESWHLQALVIQHSRLCVSFEAPISESYTASDTISYKWSFDDGKCPVGRWYRERCVCGEAV